ncbi:hypothetical protein COB64_01560 [Candidatus Wolfebacteria bacterium]|nr:MAG: hypothetical protein COB64_01560 [Candidatus Wolfebacteria bacterium]
MKKIVLFIVGLAGLVLSFFLFSGLALIAVVVSIVISTLVIMAIITVVSSPYLLHNRYEGYCSGGCGVYVINTNMNTDTTTDHIDDMCDQCRQKSW